jgi:hypothetical protein
MKQEEIIENNKLIAEFMKYDYDSTIKAYYNKDIELFCSEDVLFFDTSWDWLMPVVEKIESSSTKEYYCFNLGLGKINAGFIGIFKEDVRKDSICRVKEVISVDNCTNRLDAVYQTVIEFIKWYNENK